mmetsp:Transcript_8769/g.19914  ORF Transcript_8769/g.19914 Transcript_8769/m.19914 type:complete len:273 (+) Transcript_8769:1208-2026(+)
MSSQQQAAKSPARSSLPTAVRVTTAVSSLAPTSDAPQRWGPARGGRRLTGSIRSCSRSRQGRSSSSLPDRCWWTGRGMAGDGSLHSLLSSPSPGSFVVRWTGPWEGRCCRCCLLLPSSSPPPPLNFNSWGPWQSSRTRSRLSQSPAPLPPTTSSTGSASSACSSSCSSTAQPPTRTGPSGLSARRDGREMAASRYSTARRSSSPASPRTTELASSRPPSCSPAGSRSSTGRDTGHTCWLQQEAKRTILSRSRPFLSPLLSASTTPLQAQPNS